VLLGLLLDAFVPAGPVLLGLDDTIERRRGKCISAKILWGDEWRQAVWQNAPAHQHSHRNHPSGVSTPHHPSTNRMRARG